MSKSKHSNSGYLKLDLMLKGVRLDESFIQKNKVLTDYRLGPHCLGNVDVILPGETYVSAPYQEDFVKKSPYRIRHIKNRYYLTSPSESVPIKWIAQPDYYAQKVNDKVAIGEVASVHGGYVSLAIGGHRYLQSTLVSDDLGGNRPDLVISVDETIAVLERIRRDRPIDVISLSCWNPQAEDGGIFQIEPYIRAIKSYFNVLVFTEVHLPQRTSIIDATYAIGADSVCYHIGNLCSHGSAASSVTRETGFEIGMLKHAVAVFPPGSILAHITVGDSPFADSISDIASLTAVKVLPILTIESLEKAQQLVFDAFKLAPLFADIYNAAKRNRITMNWFSRLAPFVAPIEGRYFSGDIPRFKLALMNLYQSRFLGSSISVSLSNFRRKLRVREIKPKLKPHD